MLNKKSSKTGQSSILKLLDNDKKSAILGEQKGGAMRKERLIKILASKSLRISDIPFELSSGKKAMFILTAKKLHVMQKEKCLSAS